MRKLFVTLLAFFAMSISMSSAKESITYQISFPNPQTHYAVVTIDAYSESATDLHFVMPAWTPGSYLLREFEKSVETVRASMDGKEQTLEHPSKNIWIVRKTKGKPVKLEYKVYAYEFSVRTSFIDDSHAWLHNTSIFMQVEELKNSSGLLAIAKPAKWEKITTSLEKADEQTLRFENYDELADSPVEIGNHDIYSFNVMGVPHTLAMIGPNNCKMDSFIKHLQIICETMAAIVGEHPCKSYVFFVQNVESGGGGLEHKNSCCVMMSRWNWIDKSRYENFLGLCAHEYFHLWNVKRIRPVELGPFNYSTENYTKQLWVAEGITSYYDELAMYRAGYINKTQMVDNILESITRLENQPGSKVQSLAESSFDAWIKEYRPNENSKNTTISYYSKGLVVAALLDIQIVAATNGLKHLDDLMRLLYQRFYKKSNKGFTEKEFEDAVNEVSGKDLSSFLHTAIYTTDTLPYAEIFKSIGIKITDKVYSRYLLGCTTSLENGRTVIKQITAESPAWWGGLNVNDELIALNGSRVNNDVDQVLNNIGNPGHVTAIINRSGLVSEMEINMAPMTFHKFSTAEKPTGPALNSWLRK